MPRFEPAVVLGQALRRMGFFRVTDDCTFRRPSKFLTHGAYFLRVSRISYACRVAIALLMGGLSLGCYG